VFLPMSLSDHPADLCWWLEQLPIATPESAAPLGGSSARRLHDRAGPRSADHSWASAFYLAPTARCLQTIECNHLGTEHESERHRRAIEAARSWVSISARAVRESEAIPGPNAASKRTAGFARTGAASFGTPSVPRGMATTRMPSWSSLRVHGVRGLRVADASVMPSIPAGATHSASI